MSNYSSIIHWKDYSFSFELSCHICQNQLTVYMKAYFWTLNSAPLDYTSILRPKPHCPHYYSFPVSPEIRLCEPSNFVLLFQNCLAILELLTFHIHFRIKFAKIEKKKKPAGILTGTAIYSSIWEKYILTILGLLIHDHRISLHLVVFFFLIKVV